MRPAALALCALALGGCSVGGGDDEGSSPGASTTKVEVITQRGGESNSSFDPAAIYERDAPGVVTVTSVFRSGGLLSPDDDQAGQGSGFVLNDKGEIATNAHVVTQGEGRLRPAQQIFVQFADGNQVEAKLVGTDPFTDIALLKIDPDDLTLRPLALGSSEDVRVGEAVAAIGSPFSEQQSLTVGVVSAVDRSIRSLSRFSISGAIQTDAAINPGNSGGPLVNAAGEVIGVNQQIRTASGANEGVGFAVPVDAAKRSLEQLREDGKVEYAYLGVQSSDVYPQLAEHFKLPVEEGAWVQEVVKGGPADRAGIRAGGREVRFQLRPYSSGGDVITKLDGKPIRDADDLSKLIENYEPGTTVRLTVLRDRKPREIRVELGTRPTQP